MFATGEFEFREECIEYEVVKGLGRLKHGLVRESAGEVIELSRSGKSKKRGGHLRSHTVREKKVDEGYEIRDLVVGPFGEEVGIEGYG
jgi:hypothetical protein